MAVKRGYVHRTHLSGGRITGSPQPYPQPNAAIDKCVDTDYQLKDGGVISVFHRHPPAAQSTDLARGSPRRIPRLKGRFLSVIGVSRLTPMRPRYDALSRTVLPQRYTLLPFTCERLAHDVGSRFRFACWWVQHPISHVGGHKALTLQASVRIAALHIRIIPDLVPHHRVDIHHDGTTG